jgi:ABC-type phosphate transport system substrate-binding protein
MAAAVVLGAPIAWADDFVVVVSAKNALGYLVRAQVRDAFIGQTKQWPGGAVVQAVIGDSSSPEFAWLASRIFQQSPPEVLNRIKQEVFRGEMRRPIVAHSVEDCVSAIQRHDGGIGVVSAERAKSLPATLAVLNVD